MKEIYFTMNRACSESDGQSPGEPWYALRRSQRMLSAKARVTGLNDPCWPGSFEVRSHGEGHGEEVGHFYSLLG